MNKGKIPCSGFFIDTRYLVFTDDKILQLSQSILEQISSGGTGNGGTGTVFYPQVTPQSNGDLLLSWINDGGLENPTPVNIKGDKGDKGADGSPGIDGQKGDPFTYDDFTSAQLEALKGKDGTDYILTESDKLDIADMVDVVGKVDLSDYARTEELPTKLSQLANDSAFITIDDIPDITVPDIDISEFVTQEEFNAKLSSFDVISIEDINAILSEN